ncbi:MAG: formylglycine-generating enzyme family protein [Planctomycetota bacterium]
MAGDQCSTSFAIPMPVFFVPSLIAACGIIAGCALGAEPKKQPDVLKDAPPPAEVVAYAQQHGLKPTISLDLDKGLTLQLALIPAGKFMMGSPETEEGRAKNETPHEVTISQAFYMGKYEVTQEQYSAVIGTYPAVFKRPKKPVETVSWDDAQEFCRKLNERTADVAPVAMAAGGTPTAQKWLASLPTEAQWEYACRAGTTTRFYSGDADSALDGVAWHGSNAGQMTHPAGQKQANAWGLYDMHGNVQQWCADWYGEYPDGAATDPAGPATGNMRVLRGGSWNDCPLVCRSAYRCRDDPGGRSSFYGFRVVLAARAANQPEAKNPKGAISPASPPAEVAACAKQNGLGPALSLDLGKGVKLELVLVPAGNFTMGSQETEKGRRDNETQHEVTISQPFYMGKYVVTQEQYETVMGKNPAFPPNKGSKNPVDSVPWDNAQEFCKKLSAKLPLTLPSLRGGQGKWAIQLPTEAQWEYACRAGTRTRFYSGDADSDLGGVAWHQGNSRDTINPVGQKQANAWGVYDMHGNVQQWCADWYGEYPDGAATDPAGPAAGTERVLRGGSFRDALCDCRSACRRMYNPVNPNPYIGFRVVVAVAARNPFPAVAPKGKQEAVQVPAAPPPAAVAKQEAVQVPAAPPPFDLAAYAKEKRLAPALSLDLGNGVKLELVLIPDGKFMMGSPETEQDRVQGETQHEVTITQPFYMAKYVVTQEQYSTLLGTNPAKFKGPQNPVETVSWDEAQEFCKKLSAKRPLTLPPVHGRGKWTIQLPTEAQWEYACRAGTTARFYSGDADSGLEGVAWYAGNSGGTTHAVGLMRANAWGLYDMLGNVKEWCADVCAEYPAGEATNPEGPAAGSVRVLRGSSFCTLPPYCRAAFRFGFKQDFRHCDLGFRVVVVRTP